MESDLPACFVCENNQCVDIPTAVCDKHKLLVCDHGMALKSICSDNPNKCNSLCINDGCNKNKQYLLDGKVVGPLLSGSVVKCIDHILTCKCGKRASNYGLRSKCIGCYHVLTYPKPEPEIAEITETGERWSNDPISLFELLFTLQYRKGLDMAIAVKTVKYLDYA
jgi:hypothetical protein